MQLDAMLTEWLERAARRRVPGPPGERATAAMTVADASLPAVEQLGVAWALTIRRPAFGRLVLVEGPARVVEGLVSVVTTGD